MIFYHNGIYVIQSNQDIDGIKSIIFLYAFMHLSHYQPHPSIIFISHSNLGKRKLIMNDFFFFTFFIIRINNSFIKCFSQSMRYCSENVVKLESRTLASASL